MNELGVMCYLVNGIYFFQTYFAGEPQYHFLCFFFIFILCDFYVYYSIKHSIYDRDSDMSLLFLLIISLPFTLSCFIISIMEKSANTPNNLIIVCHWINTFLNILDLIKKNVDYYSSNQYLLYSKLKLKMKSQSFTSSDEECIICYDDEKSKDFVKLGCNHVFHRECFEKWILTKNHFQDFKCVLCSQHIYL